jgi:hypothetical protein
MEFVKKVKDVEFYYEKCADGSFKVIAHSDLQQKSAVLSYENNLKGVENCVNAFSSGFDLNGFKLKL